MRQLNDLELDVVAGGAKPPPPPAPPPTPLGTFFDFLGEAFSQGLNIVAAPLGISWVLNLGNIPVAGGGQPTGMPIVVQFTQDYYSNVFQAPVTTTGTLTIEPITGTYTVDANFHIPFLPGGGVVSGANGTFQIDGQK